MVSKIDSWIVEPVFDSQRCWNFSLNGQNIMLSHPPQRDQTHAGLKRLQLKKLDVIRFTGASFWRQIVCSLVSWNCLMMLSTLQAYLHCQRSWNKPSASVLHLQTFRIFSPRSWYCGNMVDWLKSSYRLQKKIL